MGIEEKLEKLKELLRTQRKVMVAFSAGVDSAVLLSIAHEVLGEACQGVTLHTCFMPEEELEAAKRFCSARGIVWHDLQVNPLEQENIVKNDGRRCYYCKQHMFSQLLAYGRQQGDYVLLEGSNADDLQDDRPGREALKELGILSPLELCGLTKAEIRSLAQGYGLKEANKPAMACLATRVAVGQVLEQEWLVRIAKAEAYLRGLGFHQLRVRLHMTMARIELEPEDMERFMNHQLRQEVHDYLCELGFSHVAMDLRGYRRGSMNTIRGGGNGDN